MAAAMLFWMVNAQAASSTWTGAAGGGNFSWSAAGNWSGAVVIPATGGTPIFAGSAGLSNNNNKATSVIGITFNAGSGAFNLYGNALTVIGNFTNNAVGVNETINNNITWDGSAARVVTGVSGGTLTFAGNLTRGATGLGFGLNFVAGATPGTPAVYQFSGSSVIFTNPVQTADVSAAGFTMRNNTTVNLLSGANVNWTGGFWGVGQNGNSTTLAASTLNVSNGASLTFDSTANFVIGYNFNHADLNNNTGIVNINGIVSAALGTGNGSQYIRLGLNDNAVAWAAAPTSGTINLLTGGVLATSRKIVVGANFDTFYTPYQNAVAPTASTGNFLFDGGTLKTDGANDVADWFSSANSTTGSGATTLIIQKLNSVKINVGGAFIDTAGRNATISYGMTGGATTGGGLTKQGLGTLTLSGANTYTGNTTISAGTLAMGANNVFTNAGALVLNGGTFSSQGNSDTLGALTIQSSSSISLGTNTTGTLTFASGSYTAGTLTINNWSGTAGVSGTADRIFITAAPSATFLANITFARYQAGAIWLGTGEIVPSGSLATKLAITSINGGASPTVGAAFSVVVQSQDAGGTPQNVTADTVVSFSVNTGSGTLGGTLTGTITNGTSSVTISGVTYSKAENGVILTATRTSGLNLTAGNSSSFDVSKAVVTISSGLTANKVYDGTTTATISSNNVVLAGVLAGDTANVRLSTNGYTASFASATVGSSIGVTVSGLTLTGSAAGNYTLTQPSLSANITVVTVTVTSGLVANNKVYNVTTAATISSNSVVLAGVIASDTANVFLSTNGYTATFASATVGNGKTVTVGGLTLTGSAAANYTLTQPSLSANITAVTVTVSSGLTANNKVYDATTAATISSNNVVLSGVVAGDAANVRLSTNGYTATFASATVGSGTTVTVSGLTLTGSAAGNYSLTQPSLNASITASAWYNASWIYRLAIVIDHTQVSGTLTNFPVLITFTNSSIQQYAQANGNDLLFTSADGTNKLDHEIESYTNSNGALVAWVEVPILSSTADTMLYLYYGNPSATNQQNVSATWNSNFKAVWHFNDVFTDSTSNHYDGVNTGTIAAPGEISNGRGYVTADGADKITVTGLLGSPTNITLSAWVNMTAKDINGTEFISLGDHVAVRQDNTGVVGYYYNGSAWNSTPSSTNVLGTGWRYVVYTFDDAGNSQKVYVDGVQIASSAFTASLSYAGLGANTVIGSHGNGNTGFDFNGTLDEVRVSNTARSAGWITTEYNNQNSPATFYTLGSQETAPPTSLAITSINGGSSPTVGAAFSVVVQSQNAIGNTANVVSNTAVTLSLNTGSGALGGTLTGTIPTGTNFVTISGVTYSKAESGVILTATRTSGDGLTASNSSAFTVNPATVTISSGLTANKVYDGTTTATISFNNVVLAGVLAGDTANVRLSTDGYTASFASATVGNSIGVTVSGLTLTGSAAGNYTLTQPSLSADITVATVTITSGITANDKVYDGTTTATIRSNNVVLAGVVAGDTANVKLSTNGYTATFASAAAGSSIGVTVGGLSLTGSASGNYVLTPPAGLTASITKAGTTLVLTSSALTNAHLASLTFTATVKVGGVTATSAGGTVQFVTNTVNFGGAVGLTSGAVNTNLATLPRGTNLVYAVYSGDGNYAGSTSSTLNEVITNNPPVAAVFNVSRTAGLDLLISRADLTNSWSDVDGDPVTLSGINLVTTNGVTVRTNSALILYSNTRNVNDQITYAIHDGQGGTGTGVINITVNPFVSGQSTGILTVSGGTVSMTFYGIPGFTYEVQRSTNLVDWVTISTNTVGTNGVINVTDRFTDLGGSIPSSAYYRLGWHP